MKHGEPVRVLRRGFGGLRPMLVSGLLLASCSNPTDSSSNRLPSLDQEHDQGRPAADSGPRDLGFQPDAAEAGESLLAPAAFRFECIEMRQLGSVGAEAFQSRLLETQWGSDINEYQLNILFLVEEVDPDAGSAVVRIGSGISGGPSGLVLERQSRSERFPAVFRPGVLSYRRHAERPASGDCIDPEALTSTGEAAGTFEVVLGPEQLIYIYAQDEGGIPFNCTADAALPDAVPLRAASATFTAELDGQHVAGVIHGCMTHEEGSRLCSCLGLCSTDEPTTETEGPCAGCPEGSIPLTRMLVGVSPSEACTLLIGQDAYDMDLAFWGTRLPAVPPLAPER